MAVIKLLTDYRKRINEKNNTSTLIERKMLENLEEEFSNELFFQRISVYKTFEKGSEKAKNDMINKLKDIYRRYFDLSESYENKIILLKYLCLMSNEYYRNLINFTKDNIFQIIDDYQINWLIESFEELETKDKAILEYISYLKKIKEKELNDYGGNTPSYRDIENSISIGSEYNFQEA